MISPWPFGTRDPEAAQAAGVLLRAAEYLASGWCWGADARDAAGSTCDPSDPSATEFSLIGAIDAAADELLPLDSPVYWWVCRTVCAIAEIQIDQAPPDESGELDQMVAALRVWNDQPVSAVSRPT